MTTKELNDYILHYLKKDRTQTAIMLTGEWGSGKTYYIENDLVPFLKKNKATSVVVSLYGLDDISMISKSIYMELRMSTLGGRHSEAITTGKIIAKNVIKNISGLASIILTLPDEDLNKLYESVDLADKLLIFEDVERSNIDIINLFGYVNGLVERDGVKVLLVANENEILRKNGNEFNFDFTKVREEKDEKKQENKVLEEVKKYLRIKEKTISDTIQFSGNLEQAIEHIIKEFDNYKLNMLCERKQDLYEKLATAVRRVCKSNLRTFIYAVQKAVDIIDRIGVNKYEDDFFECMLMGIIYLSSKIKADEFPKWEGDEYLSSKLGSNDMPLMKFGYDYIRWQNFDAEAVAKTYEAYKKFKFLEEYVDDEDLRLLGRYYEETEAKVFAALKNVERKLNTPDAIGIRAYCKLAYYMIYVGSTVGFDYTKSCELMIKNAKGLGKKANFDEDIFLSYTYNIEVENLKIEYEDFMRRLAESISCEDDIDTFSYNPSEIKDWYNFVHENLYVYVTRHCFLSRYNMNKIVEMLGKSTARQLHDFRGIMFMIYRDSGVRDFDESDIEAMRQLLSLINKKCDIDNQWDKIQLMQIGWLKSNLNQFIEQMS